MQSQNRDVLYIPYTLEQDLIGDCIDANDLQVQLQTRRYIVSGTSLYKAPSGSDCYIKVGDVDNDVVAIHYSYWRRCLVLWTTDDEFRYYDSSNVIERFSSYGLLSSFLARPIIGLSATRSYYGCFGGSTEEVMHPISTSEDALPSLRHEHRPSGMDPDRRYYANGVDAEELTRVLRIVNTEPNVVPSLAECDVDHGDIAEYARRVKEGIGTSWDLAFAFERKTPEEKNQAKEFYLGLVNRFDTVRPNVVRAALMHHYNLWTSTATMSSTVTIVNDFNDTLLLSFSSSGPSQPYNLPWTIQYGGEQFKTFNIDLARILMKMLPNQDEPVNVEDTENPHLLHVIADYLYSKHQEAQKVGLSDTTDL